MMQLTEAQWRTVQSDAALSRQLGERFRALRRALNLTQVALANRSGAELKSLQRFEQGRLAALSLHTARLVSDAIERPLEALLASLQSGETFPPSPTVRADQPHTRFLIAQRDAILNEPLLPWVNDSRVSVRFLWPDLLIGAPLRSQKLDGKPGTGPVLGGLRRVAYIGPPGIGKSTALRRLTLEISNRYLNLETNQFPVHIHARQYEKWTGVSSSWLGALKLPKSARLTLIVDGLDEVSEPERAQIRNAICDRIDGIDSIVVGCRSDVFSEQEVHTDFAASFDDVYGLLPWSFNENVAPFARAYFEKRGSPDLYDYFLDICINDKQLKEFVSNPFHLGLVIYLVSSGGGFSPKAVQNRYLLYQSFYGNWLLREKRRGTSRLFAKQIEQAHIDIAKTVYICRVAGMAYPTLPNPSEYLSVRSDTAFRGLFDWVYDAFQEREIISQFRHETFLEFLLSRALLQDLLDSNDLNDALGLHYNNDVNLFVRQGIDNLPLKSRLEVASRLSHFLEDRRGPISTREQAIYYLGRLGLPECPPVLVEISRNEDDPLLRRSAVLGAILYGHGAIEIDYVNEILSVPSADELNRSVQLAYFGDVKGTIFDIRDSGVAPWAKTKASIIARLGGNSSRDLRLRLWDLATLLCFLRSRGGSGLSVEERLFVTGSVKSDPEKSTERAEMMRSILAEIDFLLDAN